MKNIRAAKTLGMGTVLISGSIGASAGSTTTTAAASEATKAGDAPRVDDPAVDVAIAQCRWVLRYGPSQ